MSAVFAILFLLIIAGIVTGIYGFVFLLLVGLSILGWCKRWSWLKWLAGISAGSMVLLAVAFILIITCAIIDAINPPTVFKATFGEPPSAQVHELKSSLYWFADTGSVFLRFKTTESEFLRLVPDELIEQSMAGMQRKTSEESGDKSPQWWKYAYEPDWIYFFRESYDLETTKKGFSSETEYYAYNPKDGFAYYRFIGVD